MCKYVRPTRCTTCWFRKRTWMNVTISVTSVSLPWASWEWVIAKEPFRLERARERVPRHRSVSWTARAQSRSTSAKRIAVTTGQEDKGVQTAHRRGHPGALDDRGGACGQRLWLHCRQKGFRNPEGQVPELFYHKKLHRTHRNYCHLALQVQLLLELLVWTVVYSLKALNNYSFRS